MTYLLVACVGLAALSLFFYQPRFVVTGIHYLIPQVLWFGPDDRPTIALTFDDGPNPVYTPQVLDILRAKRIKATFFLIGENALRYPNIVQRIRDDGHLIGNHLFTDRNTLLLSSAELENSLLKTEAILSIRGPRKWVRPPGGLFGPSFLRIAAKHGYHVVLGSAYTSDTRRPPSRYIVWAMTKMLRPGAILIFHDSGGDRSHTVAALSAIIDYAHRQGYNCRTLEGLMSDEST